MHVVAWIHVFNTVSDRLSIVAVLKTCVHTFACWHVHTLWRMHTHTFMHTRTHEQAHTHTHTRARAHKKTCKPPPVNVPASAPKVLVCWSPSYCWISSQLVWASDMDSALTATLFCSAPNWSYHRKDRKQVNVITHNHKHTHKLDQTHLNTHTHTHTFMHTNNAHNVESQKKKKQQKQQQR